MTTLELENRNENRVEIQEKLTFEKLENGSVLVTTLQKKIVMHVGQIMHYSV